MTNNNFQLPILETVKLAWHKVNGVKLPFCAAIAFVMLVTYLDNMLNASIVTYPIYYRYFVFLVGSVIFILLQAGLLYQGLQRANEVTISFRTLFYAFESKVALKVIGFYLLKALIFFPLSLVILFSIYLGDVAYKQNQSSLLITGSVVGGIATITFLYVTLR